MSENGKKTNSRLTHFSTLLRLLSPTSFRYSLNYAKIHGVRLCFARTVLLLSLALGLRRSIAPLKRKVPDNPPPLNGCQDALRLELAAIKAGLTESLRRKRKTNG